MEQLSRDDSGFEYTKKIDDLLSADRRERICQDYIISPFLQRLLPDYEVVPVDIKISGKVHDYSMYCGEYGKKDKDGKLQRYIETPDLCVAQGWKWINDDGKTAYLATIEIKPPSVKTKGYWIAPGYEEEPKSNTEEKHENKVSEIVDFINTNMLSKVNGEYRYEKDDDHGKSIKKQIGIHLRGMNKVIATDGIRWLFFHKDEDGICHALEPIDLGKRICHGTELVRIDWDLEEIVIKGHKFITGPKNFNKLERTIRQFCSPDELKSGNTAE